VEILNLNLVRGSRSDGTHKPHSSMRSPCTQL